MVTDEDRMRYYGDQYYLKSANEMKTVFKDFPEAIKETIAIAEKCNLELDFSKTHLPVFSPPNSKKQEDYLEELCFELLREKMNGTLPPEYDTRLHYELSVIKKMGFSSYFLIVWDFIDHARQRGIPVGPGRGSAAGSLVAYALGITMVEPIQRGLIFERFLNPDRISMPDIDIDFCYERRDEVIEYVKQRYGEQSVAQIITFGTMAARAVIRDVGRVMGMSYQDVDRLAKMIPNELDITIARALKMEPRLGDLAKSDPKVKQLIETSKALEGISRHASTHAAGVVISDGPLYNYCPLFKTNDQITTQYDMGAVEKIGLLKMDFLGLRTLTVIDEAIKLIRRNHNLEIHVDKIPFDDQTTYDMLGRGDSGGVFQLESSGMRDLLRKMKPSHFEDLVALLALYRPGPLGSGMVDDFIRRMHDSSLIKYDHPALESILKETYGIILYQEQVMQIVSTLAGFSLAKADSLRRAIGKKIPEIMEREKHDFMDGAVKNKVPERTAERIWNLIEYFSGYGFNKSHSTAYAFISYQTAYLKANFSMEFMAALLTSEKDNTDKIVRSIEECRRLGIEVMPPSINESFSEFTCKGKKIQFGLSAVKNVGALAVESIVKEREENGSFRSLGDLTQRVDLRLCNRKVLESLIKCGTFDSFGFKRSQMMAMVDQVLERGSRIQQDRQRGQLSLLDETGSDAGQGWEQQIVPDMEEWPEHRLLAHEREMLGFFVTAHPLTKFSKMLSLYSTKDTSGLKELRDQQEVGIGGLIQSIKGITTKRGERMAFVTLEDLQGHCEIVVFPELYKSSMELLVKDQPVFVRGRMNSREDTVKIIADELVPLQDVEKRMTKVISIDLRTTGLDLDLLKRLKELLVKYPGGVPVYLSFQDPTGKRTVLDSGQGYKVTSSSELLGQLEQLVGPGAITIKS